MSLRSMHVVFNGNFHNYLKSNLVHRFPRQKLLHLLTGAILATTTPVQAFPNLGGLSPQDVFVSLTTCNDFVVGNDLKSVGQVCVGIADDIVAGTYSDIHVYIDRTIPTTTSPGQLPYTLGNEACSTSTDSTSATCYIPRPELVARTTCLTTITNIVTSIVAPLPTSTVTGCDHPNSGSPTSAITSTTTTSVDFTCLVYYPALETNAT
ncbi:hypothetical protein QL093DRAFT_2639158 [Fusarium oxysporum]|nr:hypothetical protein QL093DRAFT_2639158 [Fusarium oxysporum]